ncbi:MAG: ABC transporter substrate-binding protein, partial [Magnetococcales bacterium]|nr:ABC transporter substrate-binding protein [Magnetococcales bacterium]
RDNLRFFAGLDNLVAVVGQKTVVTGAERDLARQLALPCLLLWSGDDFPTENGAPPDYFFRVGVRDRWTVPFLVDAALARGRRPALVLENSDWGEGIGALARHHLGALGSAAAGVFWLENGSGVPDRLVDGIVGSGADVVLLADSPAESLLFLSAMSQKVPNLPVVSHRGVLGGRLTPAQMRLLGKMELVFPQTLFFAVPGVEQAGLNLLGKYRTALRLELDEGMPQGSGLAYAYDLVQMLAKAVRQAGSSERPAVRAALEGLQYHDGVVKRYTHPFDAQRRDALQKQDDRLARMTTEGRVVPAAVRR